jgi:UPF0271 protein
VHDTGVSSPPVVDLSADVGEGFGPWSMGDDRPIMDHVTTVHIACGFHAGDPRVMRRTVESAVEAGVVVGAHPAYPDLVGFGRRAMDVSPSRVAEDVLYQVGALEGLARVCGTRVRSVKPHGALYNRMAEDVDCAWAIAEALAAYDDTLWLVVPAGSSAWETAHHVGVPTVAEAFCDRGYRTDGTLADRHDEGAVLTAEEDIVERARSLVVDHMVRAVDGSVLWLEPGTLCVHGDTPGALSLATAVRRGLATAGVTVAPFAATGTGGASPPAVPPSLG